MRDPQFRQNFVSGGFSVEHVAQITVPGLYPRRGSGAACSAPVHRWARKSRRTEVARRL
jgi:hypothetical protein